MKILGMDPGVARVGWAIVEDNSNRASLNVYGCIETDKSQEIPERLLTLYETLLQIVQKYQPDMVSLEELFHTKNAKTVIPVGQARGIVLLVCAQYHLPVVSYTPLMVKSIICGDGRADKQQVQKMIVRLLKLKRIPEPDDAADAIAIALSHAYTYKLKAKLT